MFRRPKNKKKKGKNMSYVHGTKGIFHIQNEGRNLTQLRIFAVWNNGSTPYEVKNTTQTSARCIGVYRKTNSGAEAFTTYAFPGNNDLQKSVRDYVTKEGIVAEGRHMQVSEGNYIVTGGGLIRMDDNDLVSTHRIYFTPPEEGNGDVQGDDNESK